jgi:hypothetical protein
MSRIDELIDRRGTETSNISCLDFSNHINILQRSGWVRLTLHQYYQSHLTSVKH